MEVVSQKEKPFNCDDCLYEHHCDREGEWPGSVGPHPLKGWLTIPGLIETDVCLLPMVTNESAEMIKLYSHYKNNILPYQGGLLDQPAFYKRCMEVLDSAFAEKQKEDDR